MSFYQENHINKKELDTIFWNIVEKLGNNVFKCKLCDRTIKQQTVTRMKYHFIGPGYGVLHCTKVTDEVKACFTRWLTLKDSKYKKKCTYCPMETSSQMMRYHLAGVNHPGIKPCEKIPDEARKSALEEIQKATDTKGKRPRDCPNSEGPTRRLRGRLGHDRESSLSLNPSNVPTAAASELGMEIVGNSSAEPLPSPALTGYGHSRSDQAHEGPSNYAPSNQAHEALSNFAPNNPAHYGPVPSCPLPSITAHNSQYSLFSNEMTSGDNVAFEEISHHLNYVPISPLLSSLAYDHQPSELHQMTPLAVVTHTSTTWQQIDRNADAEGVHSTQNWSMLPSNTSACLPGSNQAHTGSTCHLAGGSANNRMGIVTPTEKSSNDIVKSAVQKWLLFTGLPSSHLSTSEFQELYHAIFRHGPSNSNELQLIASTNQNVADSIFDKLKHEVHNRVEAVKGSWASTKCTVCIKKFKMPNEDIYLLAAIARSQVGTVFLKYELVTLPRNMSLLEVYDAKSESFLRSVIADVGLNNISHILIPYNMSFGRSNHQPLLLVDVAYRLADAYRYLYDGKLRLKFLVYAFFTASIFGCCLDSLPTIEHLNLLSAMMEKKQQIRHLQRMVDSNFVSSLAFWKSEEAYNGMYEQIDRMLQITGRDNDFIFIKYSDVLMQESQKLEVCDLIISIIKGKNILFHSTFWESLDAYIRLYHHFHKMLRFEGNENFTFADYFSEYTEATYIIAKEDFCDHDYEMIMKGVDKLLPGEDYSHQIACYLCPQIRNLDTYVCEIENAKTELLEMMKSDGVGKDNLTAQLNAYQGKDNAFIKAEAWLPTQLKIRSDVWWQKWGDEVPDLRRLAIKILNGLCSCNRNWRIMYDMYMSMSKRDQGQKLHDLLYVRLNNHFMHIAANGQNEGTSSVCRRVDAGLTDFNDLFSNKYFTNDVY